MTAKIIDGKSIARALRDDIQTRVAAYVQKHIDAPGLNVILVGDHPASEIYVTNKQKYARMAGFKSEILRLPKNTSQSELIKVIAEMNADKFVQGILVQLPLPAQIDPAAVLSAIDPAKDVDGLHPHNVGLLNTGKPYLVPCTPQGCMVLIKSVRPTLAGLEAVVIGRSNLVGKPMAQLLLNANCHVTTVHRQTPDPAKVARRADILVVAAGQAGLVTADWVKPGATVIDVGINQKDGKIVGDVDFEAVSKVAGHITPVPGGVGPMTIACLLENTLKAASRPL